LTLVHSAVEIPVMKTEVASLGAALVVATFAAFALVWPATADELGERRGALVDQIVFTQEPDVGKVAGLIETGSHHVFAQGVGNPTVYHRLRDSERAALDISYGSSVELTINPAGPDSPPASSTRSMCARSARRSTG
jgi:hypothetical protein